MGLHFEQAAQGALEFEVQATARVEVLELDFRRDDQLHVTVVELIDHVDEPPRDVIGSNAHLLNAAQDHRVEDLAQLDVVVLATRAVAQLAELEPGHVIAGTQGDDFAVLDYQLVVFHRLGAFRRQRAEALFQAFMRRFVQREVEQLGLLKVTQTVVDTAVDVDDLGVLLDQRDGRQETCALQAVLVQAIGNDVRGGDQGHAVLEQLFHQGAEDHGIGNIGDEELIEADHPCLFGEALGDDGQRVFLARQGLHLFVHTLHEAVEVRTDLFLERQRFEEGVDQISLAAAHATPEIQAFDRRVVFLAKQLAEHPWLVVRGRDQVVVQALQMTHRIFLGRVMEEFRAFQISLISF